MQKKSLLMDDADIRRALMRIAHEIIEKNKGTDNLYLVGIKRRGLPLAQQIGQNIAKIEGTTLPCGELDIHFYRDDLSPTSAPVLDSAALPFDVTDKTIVLVDDVLYTGRTVRAAIEAIFAHGRPRAIQLAILVDRGHRELPFRADYVGKNVPTSHSERIMVHTPDPDGCSRVEIWQTEE